MRAYEYESAGLVREVDAHDVNRLKNATVDGVSISYSYNGDGLMVGRSKGSETTRYYYDDRACLLQKER